MATVHQQLKSQSPKLSGAELLDLLQSSALLMSVSPLSCISAKQFLLKADEEQPDVSLSAVSYRILLFLFNQEVLRDFQK